MYEGLYSPSWTAQPGVQTFHPGRETWALEETKGTGHVTPLSKSAPAVAKELWCSGCTWHSISWLLFFLIILIKRKLYLLWLSCLYTYTEFPIASFPENLSTFASTEFKKDQRHFFSILSIFFLQTVCGCCISK